MNSTQPSQICKPTAQIIQFPRAAKVSTRNRHKANHELTFGDDIGIYLDSIADYDRRRDAAMACGKIIYAAKKGIHAPH